MTMDVRRFSVLLVSMVLFAHGARGQAAGSATLDFEFSVMGW